MATEKHNQQALKVNNHIHNLRKRIREQLAKGTTPQKLAMTVAVGIILGLFPIVGATSLLCIGAAFAFRLNHVFIQVVNYTVYPLQVVLFIPFLKAGNHFFQLTGHTVNYQHLFQTFKTDTLAALGEFGTIILSAILLWAVIALPLSLLLYRSSLKYLKRVRVKI